MSWMLTEPPTVSVIMPAYNSARFIGEAIESVLGQTWPKTELIIIDDGSTDETASIIKSYGDRVRYVYQQNARQAVARNAGIAISKGEYLAFIDADDVWGEEKLQKQLDKFQSNPSLGLVSCSTIEIDEFSKQIGVKSTNLRGKALRSILLGEGAAGINGSSPLIPRQVIESVGLFDPELTPVEDTDMFCRIAARYPIDYVDEPLVLYRSHSGNMHRKLDLMETAWTRFYAKVLRDPAVRRFGWVFRLRCYGRLYYMLAGDYAKAGKWKEAFWYGIKSVIFWPMTAIRLFRKENRQD